MYEHLRKRLDALISADWPSYIIEIFFYGRGGMLCVLFRSYCVYETLLGHYCDTLLAYTVGLLLGIAQVAQPHFKVAIEVL